MEHGFVKVLKLDQRNLDSERTVINVEEENITKLSNYNFLIKALETYNNKKFKNDELITEFIKINLPSKNEELARKQWFDGVVYNGDTYKAWFSTVGGMKKEKYGICDTIFIREDYQEFAKLLENLISLGKFHDLESLDDTDEKKTFCINKDVLSRISLITSDLTAEIDMPNIIVLPQPKLHLTKDYKTVEPNKYTIEETNAKGEIKTINKVDYNLIDYHFNDNIDIFDGGAIATPKVFESIGTSMNRDDIEFAIIRGYGMAIKGLITKFDILGYLELMHKEIGNTDFCKKENDKFYLKDMWNQWQEVTDNTMLLNESMVKLAKYFNNMDEYKTRLEKLNNDTYRNYYNLLNKLYITKVNKVDKDISSYRRTNYQLINALALTTHQYYKLTKQDRRVFSKILKPYTCLEKGDTKEFVANTDYINLFYKQCVNNYIQDKEEDLDELINKTLTNVVDKAHELININPEFVKLNYVKMNLRSLVEKKIRELLCGKVTVKAKYQYIAIDPISYMNWAMHREQGNNGLAEGQFYSYDCNDGDIRTIARNPLSAYCEVHNVKFSRNTFLDNWLSPCRELIYFNQKSDILSLMSSADTDGDACTVIDEEIIRNAVIVPKDGKYFVTKLDGHKEPKLYNKENRFISTYKASGNLIGKIALKSANVNCNCQVVPNYYDTVNKKFINYITFKVDMEFDNDWTKEDIDKYIKEKLVSKEWIDGYDREVEGELLEYMQEKFYEYEKEIFIVLYNGMCAIDAPKTLVFPNKDDMDVIEKKYHHKVNFLQYKEKREDVIESQYYSRRNNLMDYFSYWMQQELLDIVENNKKNKSEFADREELLQKQLKNDNWCKEIYDLCFSEVEKLYKEYTEERKKAGQNESDKNHKLYKNMIFQKKEVGYWDDFLEAEYWASRAAHKKEKHKEYKEIDTKFIPVAQKLLKTFDVDTISQAISNLKKCTENFIISLFFSCLKCKGTRYIYQKCEDGDIEYLYEKYKKEAKDFDNSSNIDKLVQEDKIRLKLEQKIRFRLLNKEIIEEIKQALESETNYELKLDDKRVQAFDDYKDFLKDKVSVNIIKFDTKKDGSLAIAEKSFGVLVKEIILGH